MSFRPTRWLKAILEQLDSIIHATSIGQPIWFPDKVAQPVQAALTKLKSYLMPMLKKFLAKLWSVISHLLTPKEWKLKGKVGNTVLEAWQRLKSKLCLGHSLNLRHSKPWQLVSSLADSGPRENPTFTCEVNALT
jgi:hypothetical protein